ncbi:MAG TPA: hypothetical protein GYA08_03500 [Chloroflexi bacterium]|nr:hypothetical protein [Chloroflexota bacterium]
MRRQFFHLAAILMALLWLIARLGVATAQDPEIAGGPAAPSQALYLPVVSGGTDAMPVIHSFTANAASIPAGGSVTLAWDVSGATSLNIAPDIGAVAGVSITIAPANTTRYTLTAANAAGSVTAQTTVTVVSAPPDATGFFLVPTPNIELPTSHATMAVDPAGGVHVAFTPQAGASQAPTRPAYYAYCATNCTTSSAFTILQLGDGVDYASLALDPLGRPRLLLRIPAQSGAIFIFQYWMCDSNCLARDQWRSGAIGYTYARPIGWVEPFIHAFALDQAGRPRFIYYDNGADHEDAHRGVFYASCDSDCTDAAQWRELRLLDDPHARDFDLAFGPDGQPRMVYATYNSDELTQPVVYVECNQQCHLVESWSTILLADTVSASVSHFAVFALEVDSEGKPRVALYTGTGAGGSLSTNTLYYLTCDAAACAQAQAWSALNLGFSETHGEEGVDLALDAQNRPRLAYHAPMGAGFGLQYAWCDSDCAMSAQGWRTQKMEASEEVNAEMPIPPWSGCAFPQCNPPIPPCTVSTWDSGLRPALALDAAGNPRIAFDAHHEQGGACGTFTDTKQTRFIQFVQP